MQPYFLPYIGYFQLISSVDQFVIYDNIKYTKKGWINRNRYLQNNKAEVFTLPLQKEPDSLDICRRHLSIDFDKEKLIRKFEGAYYHAPYFKETIHFLRKIIRYEENNLFDFIHHSLVETCRYLGIASRIIVSSNVDINHELKAQERVLAMCTALGAKDYINPVGGVDLYSREKFHEAGIQLFFIQSRFPDYPQFGADFIPSLSIIDVMMFNPIETVIKQVNCKYEMI
jgi:hypothetical protein